MEYLPSMNFFRPEYNMFPEIIQYDKNNPAIMSQESEYDIQMDLTKETLIDTDVFRDFIGNAVSRFRRTKYYKDYKGYLMSLGLNRSQVLGNISDDMADLEMHHNFLTIYDIAILITEHVINTVGRINTFDLVQLIILAHQNNWVPIVFLDETSHQMFHSDVGAFLPPSQTFGMWWNLLYNFRYGITLDIARKVLLYISRFYKEEEPMIVQLRNSVLSFAEQNDLGGYEYDEYQ